jgi:hypothetical protein
VRLARGLSVGEALPFGDLVFAVFAYRKERHRRVTLASVAIA